MKAVSYTHLDVYKRQDTTMLHFGMYVFNVPVCPYNYFDSEIKIAE